MKKVKIITMIMALTMTTSMFAITANADTVTTATTVAPESTYSIQYEGHVQDIGWQKPVTVVGDQNDITTLPEAGTNGLGLRVEGIKITGVNLPSGAKIIYMAHVQNKGWMSAVAATTNEAVDSAPIGGTSGLGLRVEAFKMTLLGMPGYAIKYRAHVQNIGWQDAVETNNGVIITNPNIGEAGTNGQGLRMEALQVQIVKTDVEKAAEIKAINAVNLAESSKLSTDIAAAKTAIASVADTVEQATLTTNLTAGTLITVNNTTPVIIQQVQPVVGTEPTPIVTVPPVIDTTLSPIIDVDSPTDNQTITSSNLNIKGWALESSGVKLVTIYLDNIILPITCTVSRPDVQALYPKYNQLISGYSITQDITNLSNGIHTVTVTMDGEDGKTSTVTRKINVQLPNASHENTALEKLINPDSDFDATSGWDVSDLNKTLDSISTQYLNNQISQAQAQQEMYAYSINLPGHTNTRISKAYFTTNTTASGADTDTIAGFANSGGNYNKCKIWMNANGTNTITTIGADETSN